MYHKIQIKFDCGEIDIYRSWIMALFLLEDRNFKGFWMKIWNAGYLWSPDQLSLVLFNFYWNINEGQFDLFFQYHIPVAVTLASTVAVSQTLSTVQVNICQSMSTV